jgi:hypothetical protein
VSARKPSLVRSGHRVCNVTERHFARSRVVFAVPRKHATGARGEHEVFVASVRRVAHGTLTPVR